MLTKVEENKRCSDTEYMDSCLYAVGQSRDERCFTEVYNYYAGRVKSYLIANGLKNCVAEDLAQQVMLVLLKTSGNFDPTKVASSTWVFVIARDHWLAEVRGHPHIGTDPNDTLLEEPLI